jgi:hypothetical protein
MYIYAIGTDTRQKIGLSKDPKSRLLQLQTGNAEELHLHHSIEVSSDRVKMLEKFLHKDIGYKRLKGEWFDMTKEEVVNYLIFAEISWVHDPLLKFKV